MFPTCSLYPCSRRDIYETRPSSTLVRRSRRDRRLSPPDASVIDAIVDAVPCMPMAPGELRRREMLPSREEDHTLTGLPKLSATWYPTGNSRKPVR